MSSEVPAFGENAAKAGSLVEELDKVTEDAIRDKRIVGTVIIVSKNGQVVYRHAAGYADREKKTPMSEDTTFRLASMSKTITSAAALALVDKGILSLDDSVSKWLPNFRPKLADGSEPTITIRQLLTHTAGLNYSFEEKPDGPYHLAKVSDGLDQPGLGMAENLKRIASAPLLFPPGTKWNYSVATDVLGAVIEKAAGKPLPKVIKELVTDPLEMSQTGFTIRDHQSLAVPYADGKPEPVRMSKVQLVPVGQGSFSFAPGRIFNKHSFPSGGGGMVGTADDYMKLLEELRTAKGTILSRSSLAGMTENQIGGMPATWEPGWGFSFCAAVLTDPSTAKTPHSKGTIQWGGAYGNHWFIDPEKKLSLVELTNTTLEGRSGQFSNSVIKAVYGASH
jgi:CubicO group peptidase (beta-lactamase class C family)